MTTNQEPQDAPRDDAVSVQRIEEQLPALGNVIALVALGCAIS
jgi:translation initiation factor 6 (eIF-6)